MKVCLAECGEETLKELSHLYDYGNGMNVSDLANQFNVSKPTIRTYLKKMGVFRPNTLRQSKFADAPEKLDEMIQNYEKIRSVPEVAKMYGISIMTARNHLRKAGVLQKVPGKGRRPLLSRDKQYSLIHDYLHGKKQHELRDNFDVSLSTIASIMRQYGITRSNRKNKRETLRNVAEAMGLNDDQAAQVA